MAVRVQVPLRALFTNSLDLEVSRAGLPADAVRQVQVPLRALFGS